MNIERCQRCGSRHHTDCTDSVEYKNPNLRYLWTTSLLCIAILIVIAYTVIGFFGPVFK